jgi:hypothetical protein
MRTLTILILSFILSKGMYAQEKLLDILPVKDNKITYTSVLQADSISRDE